MCEKGNSRIHIEMEECLPNKGCELMDIRNVAISPMITSNGSVYPCTKLTYSFCALGNIYDMNLSEIVNSDEANKLYSELRKRWRVYAECENCNWKRICFKGCPAIAFEKYGTIDSISDNCEYIKP